MKNAQAIYSLLEMLAKNEEAVGHLYKTYADLFPKKNAFWLDLATEESKHAQMIRSVMNDPMPLNVGPSVAELREMLNVSFDYIADKQKEANEGSLKIKEAVKTALEIETSMLERRYFEFLQGDSSELSNLSESLTYDTRSHSEKIREELNKKRWFFF